MSYASEAPPMAQEVAEQIMARTKVGVEVFLDACQDAPGGHSGILATAIIGHALGNLLALLPEAEALHLRAKVNQVVDLVLASARHRPAAGPGSLH